MLLKVVNLLRLLLGWLFQVLKVVLIVEFKLFLEFVDSLDILTDSGLIIDSVDFESLLIFGPL